MNLNRVVTVNQDSLVCLFRPTSAARLAIAMQLSSKSNDIDQQSVVEKVYVSGLQLGVHI